MTEITNTNENGNCANRMLGAVNIMKKIFWIFTIKSRIKKAIDRNNKEKSYFNESILKSPLPADEARYLLSRIELKKEVISQLCGFL